MSITYSSVVPWGRSFTEYVNMFNLQKADLGKKILGCGDGPASFNCELTRMGGSVMSVDPIYRMTQKDIHKRIQETYEEVIVQTEKNKDKFVWTSIASIEELLKIRLGAMETFLNDFEQGLEQERYVFAEMPVLPFPDNHFDLSLSSHFLFLYSENLDYDFHLKSVREMLRVSKEARIFPILDLNGGLSSYIPDIQNDLKKDGFFSEIITVNYEFQRNGNQMLKIQKD